MPVLFESFERTWTCHSSERHFIVAIILPLLVRRDAALPTRVLPTADASDVIVV
jgi:hypothetical protein